MTPLDARAVPATRSAAHARAGTARARRTAAQGSRYLPDPAEPARSSRRSGSSECRCEYICDECADMMDEVFGERD